MSRMQFRSRFDVCSLAARSCHRTLLLSPFFLGPRVLVCQSVIRPKEAGMLPLSRRLTFAIGAWLVATSVSAQSFHVLADLKPEAGTPEAKLLLASDGFLYGTASSGGDYGAGSVFR